MSEQSQKLFHTQSQQGLGILSTVVITNYSKLHSVIHVGIATLYGARLAGAILGGMAAAGWQNICTTNIWCSWQPSFLSLRDAMTAERNSFYRATPSRSLSVWLTTCLSQSTILCFSLHLTHTLSHSVNHNLYLTHSYCLSGCAKTDGPGNTPVVATLREVPTL